MSTFDDPKDVERPTPSSDDAILNGDYEIEGNGSPPDIAAVENPGACACRYCREELASQQAESRHTCPERRQTEYTADYQTPQLIEPATHEIGAHILYESPGLSAYYGVVSVFDYILNNPISRFEYGGYEWEIVFKDDVGEDYEKGVTRYWEGGIAARPEDEYDAFNEYQIALRARDYTGAMTATYQFRPSLPNAVAAETGNRIKSLPQDLPEGVRVQVSSANVSIDDTTGLLRAMADHIGLNPTHFEDEKIHDWSSVYNLAQYVRLSRWASERLVGSDGVLMRLGDFSVGRRESVGELKWNNQDVVGKNTSFVVNRETWHMLIQESVLAKRVKHYHPEHARKHEDEDDPLSSPKLEVQYSNEFNQNNSIPWSQRHEAVRELDEALVNTLHWADIDIKPDEEVYVDDAYFGVEGSHRDIAVFEDPTGEARGTMEDLTRHRLFDGELGPKEKELLEALAVNPKSRMHYTELAEEGGASTSTVYRLFSKLTDILQRDNGYFSFADSIVEDQARRIVEKVREVGEWAKESVVNLVETEKALESEDSALASWMNAHGVTTYRSSDGLGFDLSNLARSTEQVRRLLREGYQAALNSPLLTEDFEDAMFRWNEDGVTKERNPFNHFGPSLRVLGQDVEYGMGSSW